MPSEIDKQIREILVRVSTLEKRVAELETGPVPAQSNVVSGDKRVSIKEFLHEHEPKNDVQRTLLIGYYLEHFSGYASFNKSDIEAQYRLAKTPVPKNINDKVNMCIKNCFLMESDSAKDGMKAWVLTMTGEKIVEEKKLNK
ncbi:MAG: hypothetical protein MUF19_03270 [Candidatus Pacebacteria bacterium]|jgi:hypothetical protein|nr:hypothetical protein [Candidatus Paceibacterota bacterium]